MAVKEHVFHHDTQYLILSSPAHLYPVHMHAMHWQLRDLLSLTSDNIICYSSGEEIYRLNPVTRQRDLITTLTFQPRCLVADDNWVCCGGENGDFATINISLPHTHLSQSTPRANADERLDLSEALRRPFDFDSNLSRRENISALEQPTVKVSKIGSEIVNCVTLWHPSEHALPQAHKQPIAVLSNNDNSISIVNLETSELAQQLWLADCVNRALISPDGTVLIAIGDDPYMHVYTRQPITKDVMSNKSGPEFHWVAHDRIRLKGQLIRPQKEDDMRGSFAAAFSPTGRYLAIGTQYGLICIYDACLLADTTKNPLIATCSSSRPFTRPGAIRVMEFSALPNDLLAVTEDSGRVVVFDIRHAFVTRQILEVNPHADFVTRIPITNRTPDNLIDPRLRNLAESMDSGTPSDPRQQLRMLEMRHQRHNASFTSDEVEVLNEMTAQRALRERQALPSITANLHAPEPPPTNTTRVRPPIGSFRDEPTSVTNTSSARETTSSVTSNDSNSSSAMPPISRDYLGTGRSTSESLRAFIAERNTDRERRGQPPRRRGSIILATTASALERDLSAQTDTQGLSARILPLPTGTSGDAWAQLEALYSVEPSSIDSSARLGVEMESDSTRMERNRRITAQLAQLSRNEPRYVRLGLGARTAGRASHTGPNDTTGIAWSKDGNLLYVGTQSGIYEYHVDVQSRKYHPAITMC